MTYKTIYDAFLPNTSAIPPNIFILGGMAVGLAMLIMWLYYQKPELRKLTLTLAGSMGLAILVLLLAETVLPVPNSEPSARFNNVKIVVTEGPVTDFKSATVGGRKVEEFRVNGILFQYNPADLSNPGYKRVSGDTGPIKEGIAVRIHYYHDDNRNQNIILRLEIAQTPNPKLSD